MQATLATESTDLLSRQLVHANTAKPANHTFQNHLILTLLLVVFLGKINEER